MAGYELWKVVHLLGVLTLFASLGGLIALRAAGAEGSRLFKALHGCGLLLVLLAGFAMLGQLHLGGPGSWPAWVWIKLSVWILLGASLVAIRRVQRQTEWLLLALLLLGGVAAWAALTKPGL